MIKQQQSALNSESNDTTLQKLVEEELNNLLLDDPHQHQSSTEEDDDDYPKHNVYFDKQLTHLVLSEEFDFKEISRILSIAFIHEHIDTSEESCRTRWAYLHRIRGNIKDVKEKVKEGKRARSVAAFANPYSLYSVEELIQNLQANEAENKDKERGDEVNEPAYEGYNIFKDNFRKIKDYEEYNKMEAEMKEALKMAQQEVFEEKPLFYTPEYQKSGEFKVLSEELTQEKMKKLMAFQIQMQKVARELNREDPTEHQKYEQAIKRRVEREIRQGDKDADFDQNWDQYESD